MASGVSLDSICTCKICDHDLARDCISGDCSCCSGSNHSMVMDGMEGFLPERPYNEVKEKILGSNEKPIQIRIGSVSLSGDLNIPDGAQGVVLFAHGSGSGRHSPRNRRVAKVLQEAGLGTLLFDLLTEDEEIIDEQTRHLGFDIGLLANRLIGATDWLLKSFDVSDGDDMPTIGYFGASTGAAAALVAAAKKADAVKAVVSRGGRPDLAGDEYLDQVRAPTLLLVGGNDEPVIGLNQEAYDKLKLLKEDEKRLTIVPGATHLFEEPGKLEQAAQLASGWFACFLKHQTRRSAEKSAAAE
jgi:putative phosphoribosyl transferase